MQDLSVRELKSLNSSQLKQIKDAISLLTSKAATLETRIDSVIGAAGEITELNYQEIIALIEDLDSQVSALTSRKQVFGGDITISETRPANPKEGDCWLDLSILR